MKLFKHKNAAFSINYRKHLLKTIQTNLILQATDLHTRTLFVPPSASRRDNDDDGARFCFQSANIHQSITCWLSTFQQLFAGQTCHATIVIAAASAETFRSLPQHTWRKFNVSSSGGRGPVSWRERKKNQKQFVKHKYIYRYKRKNEVQLECVPLLSVGGQVVPEERQIFSSHTRGKNKSRSCDSFSGERLKNCIVYCATRTEPPDDCRREHFCFSCANSLIKVVGGRTR